MISGYTTIFNNFPLFSVMVDKDVTEEVALEYSPLYKTLQKGRIMSLKTFLIWLWMAIF